MKFILCGEEFRCEVNPGPYPCNSCSSATSCIIHLTNERNRMRECLEIIADKEKVWSNHLCRDFAENVLNGKTWEGKVPGTWEGKVPGK